MLQRHKHFFKSDADASYSYSPKKFHDHHTHIHPISFLTKHVLPSRIWLETLRGEEPRKARHTPIPAYGDWHLCHSNSLASCQAVGVARQEVPMATFVLPSWYVRLASTKADKCRIEDCSHLGENTCIFQQIRTLRSNVINIAKRLRCFRDAAKPERSRSDIYSRSIFKIGRNLWEPAHTFTIFAFSPSYIMFISSPSITALELVFLCWKVKMWFCNIRFRTVASCVPVCGRWSRVRGVLNSMWGRCIYKSSQTGFFSVVEQYYAA